MTNTDPSAPAYSTSSFSLPERPGQPECQHYLRTGSCRFGVHCKFHHPRNPSAVSHTVPSTDASSLPPPPKVCIETMLISHRQLAA